jgi:hypothetical protein
MSHQGGRTKDNHWKIRCVSLEVDTSYGKKQQGEWWGAAGRTKKRKSMRLGRIRWRMGSGYCLDI